jgi:shikimate dehydrogenase
MRQYGIIGYPLRYTLSPPMHNAAFQTLGIIARYEAYPVQDIQKGMRLVKGIPLDGASITIPHKMAIMDLLDGLDEVACQIRAVNTVVREERGLIGYNTDWIGAVRGLEEVISLQGRRILLIGAGGAAMAVAYGVNSRGGKLWVTCRDQKRGEAVSCTLDAQFLPWDERGESCMDIVINATPLGEDGQEDILPLPVAALHEGMVVMDLVYHPLKTRFVREAQGRGCRIIDGLRMLLYQGGEQFALWTGERPPWEVMEKVIYGQHKADKGI